jgi:hypothetical protein
VERGGKGVKVELFLLERLEEFLDTIIDPWGAGFRLEMVLTAKPRALRYRPQSPRSAVWHAGRVRYLMQHPEELEHPIDIDCECVRGQVLAVPIILDGWHRYSAHRMLKSRVVPASFGGRVDLARYLSGKTNYLERDE